MAVSPILEGNCPFCSTRLIFSVKERSEGKAIDCPLCKRNFVIEDVKSIVMQDKNNRLLLDKWALFFSILGVFGLGLFGWIGFGCGLVALDRIQKDDRMQGRTIARWAVGLGFIWGPFHSFVKMMISLGY